MQEAHFADYGRTAAYSATSPDAVGVQPELKQAIRKASIKGSIKAVNSGVRLLSPAQRERKHIHLS